MKITINAFLGLLIAMVVTVTTLAQEMNPEAAKLYNAGNEKLKAGDYNVALDNYKKALAIEKDYRIYYQQGITLKKSGKMDEAKSAFEASVKEKSDFEAGYNALGGVYFSMGDYNSAIKNFEKVLSVSDKKNVKQAVQKNLSLAYAKLGTSAMSDGNSDRAVEYLQKSVENNNYDAAYLSLAKIYSETGDNDKAISAAESALKYRSSISKGGPYYYMGIAYKNKNDMTKAKQMFNEAKSDATYRKLVDYELSVLE